MASEMKDWYKEVTDLQSILSEMEVKRIEEPVFEEDKQIYGRKKAEILSKSIEKEEIKEVGCEWGLEINYFMDGFQRTAFLGWVRSSRYMTYVPVHLHLSGVAVIEYNQENETHRVVYGPKYQVKISRSF